jgi:hypothetical protein
MGWEISIVVAVAFFGATIAISATFLFITACLAFILVLPIAELALPDVSITLHLS